MLLVFAAQGPALTSVQAGAITRTVTSYLAPSDRPIGSHPVAGRTVVFDRHQSMNAFAPLVGKVDPREIATTLPSLILGRDKAVVCAADGNDCTIARDGVFVSIDRVERRGNSGEYLVVATALWGEPRPGGGHELKGGTYRLTLALRGTKWKHWEVIASEPKVKF
jgi:hypothetical protein